MKEEKLFTTKEGLEEKKRKLAHLKNYRPQLVEGLTYAVELGDLRENAEYDATREECDSVDERINELEYFINHAVIIEKTKNKKSVQLTSTVTIEFESGDIEEYTIVGNKEADPNNNKISYVSPLGEALMNMKKGSKVIVNSASDTYKVKIVDIK